MNAMGSCGGATRKGLNAIKDIEAVRADIGCSLDIPQEELPREENKAAGVPRVVDREEAILKAVDLQVSKGQVD